MPNETELAFHAAMLDIYQRAVAETDYTPSDFRKMVLRDGGVTVAKKLLHDPNPAAGFATLILNGRLDLSVEVLVLQPEWQALFTDFELSVARERLKAVNYVP